MWYVNGNNLQMAEGDYGLTLPITISGTELTAADTIVSGTETDTTSSTLSYQYCTFYWNKSGSRTAGTTSYGVYSGSPVTTSPSYSGMTATITIKSGDVYARCNTTYFSTASAAAIDTANSKIKWLIQVFRCPRTTLKSQLYKEIGKIYNNPL